MAASAVMKTATAPTPRPGFRPPTSSAGVETWGSASRVAGLDPDDIEITFAQGTLTVSGQRKTALGTDGDDSFYIRERFHGAFRRAITLPADTNESQISAEFENGLVDITVKGGASAGDPRRIALQNRSGAATTRSLG